MTQGTSWLWFSGDGLDVRQGLMGPVVGRELRPKEVGYDEATVVPVRSRFALLGMAFSLEAMGVSIWGLCVAKRTIEGPVLGSIFGALGVFGCGYHLWNGLNRRVHFEKPASIQG
jgi:FtsP/CotA-like multicopper oxidase with cupredoxin domain